MGNFRDNLTKLVPYEAGMQISGSDVIKLNANENPYPPSPEVGKVLRDYKYEDLNKYPSLGVSDLDKAIADHHGVDPVNVLSGNGSDEIFAMCYKAFFNSNSPIVFPDVTYSFYPVWCDFFDIPYEEIPVSASFEINVEDYISRENGGIIIPNPNAPTGIELELDSIEKLASGNRSSVVIIDEAYSDFGQVSATQLIRKYDNLLITKTLSKARSLAGQRIGYAIGSEDLIKALGAAMYSFNGYPLSSISIAVGAASMRDDEYLNSTIRKIQQTKGKTKELLIKKGFELTESKTNFLFMTHKNISALDLCSYLLEKKILVRHFDQKRIDNHLRVSIGTDDEMKKFLDEVTEYMEDRDVI